MALDIFREVYAEELDKSEFTTLERGIMESPEIRGFVFEVCKRLCAIEPSINHDTEAKDTGGDHAKP